MGFAEEMIVKTTKVGVVHRTLSMLGGNKTKTEFVCAIIRRVRSNFERITKAGSPQRFLPEEKKTLLTQDIH